jgi:hypothetical protein
MIEMIIHNLKGGISEAKLSGTDFHRLILAVIAGSIGFCTFFTTLVLFKFFNHIFGYLPVFTIDTGDILLSSIGFICLFLIPFLDKTSEERS